MISDLVLRLSCSFVVFERTSNDHHCNHFHRHDFVFVYLYVDNVESIMKRNERRLISHSTHDHHSLQAIHNWIAMCMCLCIHSMCEWFIFSLSFPLCYYQTFSPTYTFYRRRLKVTIFANKLHLFVSLTFGWKKDEQKIG